MKAIDAHAHIYPAKIAQKAVDSVGDFYHVAMEGNGTVEALLAATQTTPLTNFIVHSVALKAEQVESINDFIAEQCALHAEFIGFATMHQDYPEKEKEIERAIEAGLQGIKIHPDSQQVNLDDERLMEVYEIIEGRLPVIIHTGDYRYDFSHPCRTKRVLRAFPELVVNAAHFGGWSVFDIAFDYLEEENCFMDMSSSRTQLGLRRMKELINAYGTDRIMFASDFPMWDPTTEYHHFMSLGFGEDELEKLLWKNAERFLYSKH
ncbi:MAG: amidohydrolase family protein [Eggerthellaceae bacterium]|jgi:predicted TIM-barrel fold metal-dependent hydrolase|nr:amidohydrolase family protein [Eggerthellaceae bacterium]MDR2721589.1 amidohydrolase family protein [Coriobacteriaceae bacterium]